MGHSFRGSSCRYCGCSIYSLIADEECGGQERAYQLGDEMYQNWKERDNDAA